MQKIPYPTITENGQATHVVLPLEVYLRLAEDADLPSYDPSIAAEGGAPMEVVKAVLQGENPLKAWRKYLSLTQEDVAQKMGVSRAAYTQMEQSGRPHGKTLERAAEVFGTSKKTLEELYE